MARAIMGATMFIDQWQRSVTDLTADEITDRLGKLLAIVTPDAAKAKAKKAKAKQA
jgi:hypothetical protein